MPPAAAPLDARPVPSLADQIRADRHRRRRRRRAAAGLLVTVAAAVLAGRVVAGLTAEGAGATTATTATTAATAPPTTSAATELRPGLVDAFRRARTAAAVDGHDLTITSGYRTAEQQAALLEAEVAERGSVEAALWWVFPPERSMHVQGLAIDVGDGPAADWLASEGARFGLCRTLSWEWWHFEWREGWEASGTCPAPAQTPDEAPSA
jgi:hypothetical protein